MSGACARDVTCDYVACVRWTTLLSGVCREITRGAVLRLLRLPDFVAKGAVFKMWCGVGVLTTVSGCVCFGERVVFLFLAL